MGLAKGIGMNPIFIPRTTMFAMLTFFSALVFCNKPTSGSSLQERREGGLGAKADTIRKEEAGEAIPPDPKKKG